MCMVLCGVYNGNCSLSRFMTRPLTFPYNMIHDTTKNNRKLWRKAGNAYGIGVFTQVLSLLDFDLPLYLAPNHGKSMSQWMSKEYYKWPSSESFSQLAMIWNSLVRAFFLRRNWRWILILQLENELCKKYHVKREQQIITSSIFKAGAIHWAKWVLLIEQNLVTSIEEPAAQDEKLKVQNNVSAGKPLLKTHFTILAPHN